MPPGHTPAVGLTRSSETQASSQPLICYDFPGPTGYEAVRRRDEVGRRACLWGAGRPGGKGQKAAVARWEAGVLLRERGLGGQGLEGKGSQVQKVLGGAGNIPPPISSVPLLPILYQVQRWLLHRAPGALRPVAPLPLLADGHTHLPPPDGPWNTGKDQAASLLRQP